MTTRQSIQTLLDGSRYLAVDIGARGDVPSPWLAVDGHADFICFEPDEQACDSMRRRYDARGNGARYRIVSTAVTSTGGPRTLHLTAGRGGSSLFDPDIPIIREYTDDAYLYPIERITIQTRPVAEVFAELGEAGADLMKLDIQGCELDVLQGLETGFRDSLLMVELEASMQPKNDDYPVFTDVNQYMLAQGFELLDVWPNRVRRQKDGRRAAYQEDIFGVYVESPSVSPRIWEVDALYVRSLSSLIEARDTAQIRKLAVSYSMYGYYSEALHALGQARDHGLIDAASQAISQQAVVDWHRAVHFRRRYSLGWIWGLYRDWLHRRRLPAQTTHADYGHRMR